MKKDLAPKKPSKTDLGIKILFCIREPPNVPLLKPRVCLKIGKLLRDCIGFIIMAQFKE